ncbi:MAG: sugar phosphate isomerase/epimerase family protein [Armatimonadota bacterium]
MGRLKVGAFLSSFRMDVKSSLKKAQEIGLSGIQLSSVGGEIDVENIDECQALDIMKLFEDHGLEISAVCGDIGGFSINDESLAKSRVERTMRIMETTKLLGANIVQSHIGHIPDDLNGRTVSIMRRALEEIGSYGEQIDVYFASETGPESAATLKSFLDTIAIPTMKVNYDPANLVMSGFEHISGVYELRDYIIHTHAKDGCRTPDANGEMEQPLGEGEVGFLEYIKALDDIGYNGYYVIEREVGMNPAEDIAQAKRFLDQF